MANNKTNETDNSVTEYTDAIADDTKRNDCKELVALFSHETGFPAKMWGTGIVGFGSYHYKYESGREGDAPLVAFAARANAIVLYLSAGFDGREDMLKNLGKHKEGKGCIYIKRTADIDTNVLKKMIDSSVAYISHKYPVQPG